MRPETRLLWPVHRLRTTRPHPTPLRRRRPRPRPRIHPRGPPRPALKVGACPRMRLRRPAGDPPKRPVRTGPADQSEPVACGQRPEQTCADGQRPYPRRDRASALPLRCPTTASRTRTRSAPRCVAVGTAAQHNLFNRMLGCLHHCLTKASSTTSTPPFPTSPSSHPPPQLDRSTASVRTCRPAGAGRAIADMLGRFLKSRKGYRASSLTSKNANPAEPAMASPWVSRDEEGTTARAETSLAVTMRMRHM